MGARAGVIITAAGEENSPVLCQHWGGNEFHESIREYVTGLYKERAARKPNENGYIIDEPADRLEPSRVFIKIVTEFGAGGYVECSEENVDAGDYGILTVDLGEDKPTFTL